MNYAQRIERAIEDSKLKQVNVAALAGIGQQTLNKLIRANSKGSQYTAQIAKACGVDAYWLATGKGSMKPAAASDLPAAALELARAWLKLPDFKRRSYLQALIADAAILDVFPEIENAMRAAMVAVDPDYHKVTEGFIRSREQLEKQLKLNFQS